MTKNEKDYKNERKSALSSSIDKIKKSDVKKLVKVLTLLWGLILIVLMTVTNIGINKDFDWVNWASNSLIIFGIMVFGLLMGESNGKDKQKQKPNGLYQTTLNKYERFSAEINDELVYFNQFYSWLLPQEITMKKIDYLVVMGIDPAKAERIVRYCSYSDFRDMCDHVIEVMGDNGEKILIRKLDPHEVDPVEDVLKGVIKLNAANANYFMSAFSESKMNDRMVEEGGTLQRQRRKSRMTNRIVKIVTSLTISLVWGLLTVYDFISGEDTQAWVNLISRITALCTSFLSGWASSIVDIKLQSRIIENKYKVLSYFHTCLKKGIFVPKLEEELAKEELEEYRRKQEEAKNSVITPDIIDPSELSEEKTEGNMIEEKKKDLILLQ